MEDLELILIDIQEILPVWKELRIKDLSFELKSGCTNKIFQIKIVNSEKIEIIPNILIYREFCTDTTLINKANEKISFQALSAAKIGPKLYGVTEKFRLEEFIFGEHPKNKEMFEKKFNRKISKYFKKINSLKPELINTEPLILEVLNLENKKILIINENISNLNIEENALLKLKEIIRLLYNNENEINFLKNNLPKNQDALSFCHNDLNPLNIIKKSNDFIIIDCDYCGINYRGFDLAAYFLEIPFDYNDYPNIKFLTELEFGDKEIEELCKYYTFYDFVDKFKLEFDENEINEKEFEIDKIIIKNNLVEEFKNYIKTLIEEIRIGALLVFFYFGLWSIYQFITRDLNPNEFLLTAIVKFNSYFKWKAKYF